MSVYGWRKWDKMYILKFEFTFLHVIGQFE